jgi:hypothetical protein
MTFTLQTWKDQTDGQLQKFGGWLERLRQAYAPYLLYGTLCGMTLWPLVEVARKGQALDVMLALGGVAAGVGGNLLAEQVQRWKDGADEDAVREWVVEQAPANPELRATLDTILDQLDAIPQAQIGLSPAGRQWFAATLGEELSRLGSLARFEASLAGSGAIAQGGSRAVGQGGVLVEGNVQGDIVTGSKTTLFDQRGQKVGRQFNIAGDWTGEDLPGSADDEEEGAPG